MLDRKFILENVDEVKRNCADRGMQVDVDRFVELETRRKAVQADVEESNRQANLVSKSIGKAKDAEEREVLKRALRIGIARFRRWEETHAH